MIADGALTFGVGQHAAAASLVAIDMVSRAWRLMTLVPVSFRTAIATNTASDALAAVTPVRMGGEPLRFAKLVRDGQDPPVVLAALAMETIVDAVLLGLGAVVAAVAFTNVAASGAVQGARGASWWWVVLVLAIVVGIAWFAATDRAQSAGRSAARTIKESWRVLRAQTARRIALTFWWTFVSFGVRGLILPVLVIGVAGITSRTLWFSAVGALYTLMLAPTPGGAGLVELGFFAGLRETLGLIDLARLIVVWRVYLYAVTGTLGALLLVRDWLAPRPHSKPVTLADT